MFVRSRVRPAVASGSITHGSQITASNTGYGAYFDSALGRNVQLSDLTTVTGNHDISDFVSSGGTLTRRRFTGSIRVDVPCTLRACLFESSPVSGFLGGGENHTQGWVLDYCSIDSGGGAAQEQGIQYQSYTANRCYIVGNSDGAKVNGGGTIVRECYVRTKAQNDLDHNDGLQCVGGAGNILIERCNIDNRPVGGGGGVNCPIFVADSPTNGTCTIRDNLVAGGQYGMGLHDAVNGSNYFYVVTGNRWQDGTFNLGPVAAVNNRAGSMTWSNNAYLVSGTAIGSPS